MRNETIVIGRLLDAFGLKGWLHIASYTDPADNIFRYSHWQIQIKNNAPQPIEIEAHQPHGNSFVVKFKHCNDRDQALLLKGAAILIHRSALPPLKPNEYYWSDLEGLSVMNTQGISLGTVDHLFETGANDVIVTKGEKTHYIPYLKNVVISVDLDKKCMIVEWEPL